MTSCLSFFSILDEEWLPQSIIDIRITHWRAGLSNKSATGIGIWCSKPNNSEDTLHQNHFPHIRYHVHYTENVPCSLPIEVILSYALWASALLHSGRIPSLTHCQSLPSFFLSYLWSSHTPILVSRRSGCHEAGGCSCNSLSFWLWLCSNRSSTSGLGVGSRIPLKNSDIKIQPESRTYSGFFCTTPVCKECSPVVSYVGVSAVTNMLRRKVGTYKLQTCCLWL